MTGSSQLFQGRRDDELDYEYRKDKHRAIRRGRESLSRRRVAGLARLYVCIRAWAPFPSAVWSWCQSESCGRAIRRVRVCICDHRQRRPGPHGSFHRNGRTVRGRSQGRFPQDHNQDRADRDQGFKDFACEIAVDNHEKFFEKSGRLCANDEQHSMNRTSVLNPQPR